jgi:hypothetical protein
MPAGVTAGMSRCSWCAFGSAVTIGECRRSDPRIECVFVTPASDDEPLITAIGGLEQFETLEAVGAIDCASTGGESMSEFVAGLGRNGDGIDANYRHG